MIVIGMTTSSTFSQETKPQEMPTTIPHPFAQSKNSELLNASSEQWQYQEILKAILYDRSSIYKGDVDMSNFEKLEWVIQTNKTTYQLGEPIGFRVSVRNISPEEVKVLGTRFFPGYYLCSMQIKKIRGDERQEVYLTQKSRQVNYYIMGPESRRITSLGCILQPGEMRTVILPPFETLNLYYDISREGEYELTFYTRDFLADDEHQIGEYPKPCTVRFKIEGNTNWLDNQVVWQEEK